MVKDPGMDKSSKIHHTMDVISTTDEGLGTKHNGPAVTASEYDPRVINRFDRYTETDRLHQQNVDQITPGDEPVKQGNIEHGARIQ